MPQKVDFKDYDSILNNFDAFCDEFESRASEAFNRGALQYADNLEDHLLIIHGMQDHVVPFKTTVVLAEELIRLGKDFDFVFAPGATHSWTRPSHNARYLFGKLLTHFDRHLGPGPQ